MSSIKCLYIVGSNCTWLWATRCVSYKKQKGLSTFRDHMGKLWFSGSGRIHAAHRFSFMCCVVGLFVVTLCLLLNVACVSGYSVKQQGKS